MCEWCSEPLLYMPQDPLPATRRYCTDVCARRAWLVMRARRRLTSVSALEVAIRRLRRSRYPRQLAAAARLTELMNDLQAQRDEHLDTVDVKTHRVPNQATAGAAG